MQRPVSFTDEMIQGDFKSFKHEHHFKCIDNGTIMIDVVEFESPFAIVGRIFNRLYLKAYIKMSVEKEPYIREYAHTQVESDIDNRTHMKRPNQHYTRRFRGAAPMYNVSSSIVVIMDVKATLPSLRFINGAPAHHPRDSVANVSASVNNRSITAGGGRTNCRGLIHGNSPFEYPREFIGGKKHWCSQQPMVQLLHMHGERCRESLPDLFQPAAVCEYLIEKNARNTCCAAWKDR